MSEFSKRLLSQIHSEGITSAQLAQELGCFRKYPSSTMCQNPPYWLLQALAKWMEERGMDAVGTVSVALADKAYIPFDFLEDEANHRKLAKYAMELWQEEYFQRRGEEAKPAN